METRCAEGDAGKQLLAGGAPPFLITSAANERNWG
jgi:hypothetical protein